MASPSRRAATLAAAAAAAVCLAPAGAAASEGDANIDFSDDQALGIYSIVIAAPLAALGAIPAIGNGLALAEDERPGLAFTVTGWLFGGLNILSGALMTRIALRGELPGYTALGLAQAVYGGLDVFLAIQARGLPPAKAAPPSGAAVGGAAWAPLLRGSF